MRSPDRWATSGARAWIAASVARVELEPERRGEPDGADHPQRILLEPGLRLADGAQDPRGDVGPAAERVDECTARARRHRRQLLRRLASLPTPSR